MRKRIGIALALVAVLVAAVVVPSGLAATKKSHNAASHVVLRSLQGNTVTGTVNGKLGGGAVVYTVTANPNGSQHLAGAAFYSKGTVRVKADITFSPTANPDGSTSFSGTGKFTGGTGKFRGSTGSFTTTGAIASDGLITADIKGNVTY
jgi:hypothetical protein